MLGVALAGGEAATATAQRVAAIPPDETLTPESAEDVVLLWDDPGIQVGIHPSPSGCIQALVCVPRRPQCLALALVTALGRGNFGFPKRATCPGLAWIPESDSAARAFPFVGGHGMNRRESRDPRV